MTEIVEEVERKLRLSPHVIDISTVIAGRTVTLTITTTSGAKRVAVLQFDDRPGPT